MGEKYLKIVHSIDFNEIFPHTKWDKHEIKSFERGLKYALWRKLLSELCGTFHWWEHGWRELMAFGQPEQTGANSEMFVVKTIYQSEKYYYQSIPGIDEVSFKTFESTTQKFGVNLLEGTNKNSRLHLMRIDEYSLFVCLNLTKTHTNLFYISNWHNNSFYVFQWFEWFGLIFCLVFFLVVFVCLVLLILFLLNVLMRGKWALFEVKCLSVQFSHMRLCLVKNK